MGGLLSDMIGPQAPWFGGAVTGALAVLAFWLLQARTDRDAPDTSQLSQP